MKKLLILALIIGSFYNANAQCSNNILFIVDDSGSINNGERNDMRNSIQALSDEIFAINPSSRIGLIQYGQPDATANSQPSYYLTLPLTVNPTIVLNDDPGGNVLIQDVLPNSINTMINDNLFSAGGEFENIDSIFIFTDALVSESCFSVLTNCSSCPVAGLSCGYDYLLDLSNSLGSIPISVFRVASGTSANGIAQNGGLLIEQGSFVISGTQIDLLTDSLICLDADIEFINTCLGDATSFTINSSDPIVSILWDFGDGNTSNLENPSHTYATTGTYTVTVTYSSATETSSSTIDVTITDTPIANTISDFVLCDDASNDGFATFDLSTKDNEALGSQPVSDFSVSYFETMLDAENNTNEIGPSYTNLVNNQEIFAKVYPNNNPGCYAITSFFLIVDLQPTANPVSDYMICDDASNDGIETFDLSIKDVEILGTQSTTDFGMLYFLNNTDAINHVNDLPTTYTNTVNNQEIFVKIFNLNNTDCYVITSFFLIANPQPVANTIADYSICENDSNMVDLTQFNSSVLNGQSSSEFTISYHLSQDDADTGNSSLNTNFEVFNDPEVLFIRIENSNNSDCYDTTTFNITTFEFPFDDEVVLTCVSDSYTLDATVDDPTATYLWDDGSTSPTIVVNTFATYGVNITIGSCSKVKLIDLLEDEDCFIPNGISPNGDGKNDTFEISWLRAKNIIIFNRYGTEIYHKDNYRNEWGGTSDQGHDLPTGTYFYVITDENNELINGWIYLHR